MAEGQSVVLGLSRAAMVSAVYLTGLCMSLSDISGGAGAEPRHQDRPGGCDEDRCERGSVYAEERHARAQPDCWRSPLQRGPPRQSGVYWLLIFPEMH